MTTAAATAFGVQAYLFFAGNCEQAIEFYHQKLGARLGMKMRFKEAPPCEGDDKMEFPDNWDDKIMHCEFTIGETTVMASDGCGENAPLSGFALSLNPSNESDARRLFEALASDGGTIVMPLTKTFWSPAYGMVTDKFGVRWMVNVPQ